MADQWYYEHETTKRGPFSADQLKKLAADGSISLTDTIWKDGVVRGLVASKVKNLFPPNGTATLPESPPALAKEVRAPEPSEVVSPGSEPGPQKQPAPAAMSAQPPSKPTARLRAVAGRGIIITNQDGMSVWFKKKCFVCGIEDSSRGKMMIKRGINRMSFLCNKCRKMREAEFQGMV